MSNPWQAFELGYVTIELESAFIVGAADGDNLFDAVFVTDANGLPCIPGESLAGVLRHALAGDKDPSEDENCRRVFGFQQRDQGDSSRLRVSFAHVHSQDDKPVAFRGANVKGDPVLAALQAGVGRDHVRIGMNGTAEQRGKFDELLIPAGARFTFELCLARESQVTLKDLVGLLARTDVRLGGKTRRGLGQFKVVKVTGASFDLSKKEDVKRLGQLPVALERAVTSDQLKPIDIPKATASPHRLNGKLTLTPIGTWAIGGGMPTGREPERGQEKPWDRVPLTERTIQWKAQGKTWRGEVTSERNSPYLVPATSVKGALRHRTAFHARRLNKEWLGEASPGTTEAERVLFGEVRAGQDGAPGRVYLSDLYLPPETKLEAQQHVSLDRFTQGPMDHLLYDELVLGSCELKLDITVDLAECGSHTVACQALEAALADLCAGRLALGVGRGHGRFKGQLTWDGAQRLVREEAATC